ncbi:MAG: hypothetical protein QOD29_4240 [Alphaproteobacteria bacterium]|jgi:hypothetical protein|nr:hypothetical protein [Alphaproteobacteria bacterium]
MNSLYQIRRPLRSVASSDGKVAPGFASAQSGLRIVRKSANIGTSVNFRKVTRSFEALFVNQRFSIFSVLFVVILLPVIVRLYTGHY